MLRSTLFSLTWECVRCSDSYCWNGLRSHTIAYWLSSAWHVSCYIAVDASNPTQLNSANMTRNNWHLCMPWRLMTGQGYSIIKSTRIHWTFNDSASNEARNQIDTRFPWYPAKDHRTGILITSWIGIVYSTQVNSVTFILWTFKQGTLPPVRANPVTFTYYCQCYVSA